MSIAAVALGELTKIRTGKLDANAANENGAYPFFTCAVEPLSINTAAFDCKAVLVAGNGDLNVKYYEGKFNAYQRTYVIESLDECKLLPKYLYLFLDKYVEKLREQAIGGVIKYIKLGNLTEANIPLPPLAQQQRIAAILDKAAEIKAKREQTLEKLDELAQSVFEECANESELKKYCLDEIADFYAGNSLPTGLDYKEQADGFFLMKVSDMNMMGNEKYIYKCKEWSATKGTNSGTCPSGSIVIPKRGGAIGTNKKRITTRPTILDPNLMAIKANENVITTEFLMQWFLRFDLASITSGSSVPQLNKKDLAPLEVLVPSLQVQKELGVIFRKIEQQKLRLTKSLKQIIAIQSSLQHQAFTIGFAA